MGKKYLWATSVAGIALLSSTPAWAECNLTQPDVVCDGTTGPNTTPVITDARSVRFINGQTQQGTGGLVVNGGANNAPNVTIDAGSSISATTAEALTLRGGNTLATGGATATINGNLSSTQEAGLLVTTITANGATKTISQGANSTISGTTGIAALSQFGTITINSLGTITGSSDAGIGVIGATTTTITTNGNVTGDAAGTGSFADGINVNGQGLVTVTANTGTIRGDSGLTIVTLGDTRITGNAAFIGTTASGIDATTTGNLDMQITGPVTGVTSGINALVVGNAFGPPSTGTLTISSGGLVTASAGHGIQANANTTNAAGVAITNNGEIRAVGGFSAIFARSLGAGTGSVVINNTGTLTGGANAISGSTIGTAFRITNSGTMNGAVNVTGSAVGTSLLTNMGTWNLGPGNSAFAGSVTNSGTLNMADGTANTLTISGDLVFNPGSIFRFDVGATQGATDRVNVTGTAALNGGVMAFGAGGRFTVGSYVLLNAAGGISGTFSPLTTNPNAPVSLRYDGNNVFLDVTAGSTVLSSSERQSIVFTAPVVTTNRVTNFSTQIIGRLLGGTPLYDQTFAFAFSSAQVQNGVTAARAAITTAGGPGVIIGAPVRTANSTTSSTSSVTNFALTGTQSTIEAGVVTFGPATLTVGALSTCNVAMLPSATRPTCTNGGSTLVLTDADTNINVNTNTVFTVAENRTDTVTETVRETYELNGQVVAVGSIHAEVQSGLFDLGGRLLGRLAQAAPGRAGWADAYRFRVSQAGRRDAWGIAGGFSLPLGEALTLTTGIGQGWLDIDVPGAQEVGEVELTEFGGALRYASDSSGTGFGASLAAVHGFGKAQTSRTIIGQSDAEYDVKVSGVALDMGYGMDVGGVTLRPVAGLDYVRISSDAFRESDTLGLIAGSQRTERVRATAGLDVAKDFGGFTLAASARYLAILSGDERGLPVAFAVAPGTPMAMTGPSEPGGALLGASALIDLAPGAQLTFGYDGRFGGGYTSHSGNVGVRISF